MLRQGLAWNTKHPELREGKVGKGVGFIHGKGGKGTEWKDRVAMLI